jgi:hypothetical protein
MQLYSSLVTLYIGLNVHVFQVKNTASLNLAVKFISIDNNDYRYQITSASINVLLIDGNLSELIYGTQPSRHLESNVLSIF